MADRLQRARRRHFVGRGRELALFREAVEAAEPPFTVLFLHGPGGVGKTALLGELAAVAEAAGVPCTRLDLRAITPSPSSFEAAVGDLGPQPRRILLLDTYEAAAPLDRWLRERFLPALAAGTVVVIAGRTAPADAWLADPGWRALLRVVALRNLDDADAAAYLRSSGVEAARVDAAVRATRGHPLALSLFVDVLAQRSGGDVPGLVDAPDVVRVLLARFVDEVPGPLHRRALEACAHARFTTEDLLRAAIPDGDAAALFAWLRTLSFVEENALGLFPHDLARDVLDADLRWRAPDRYAELHRGIRAHAFERLRRDASLVARRTQSDMADLLFMHRRSRVLSAALDWATLGQTYADRLQPDDRAVISALAEPASAALVDHWQRRQPGAFVVFRDADGDPQGFVAILALHEATEADLAADPGTAAMSRYARRGAAPRPGDEVFALRFLVFREDPAGTAAMNAMALVHPVHVLGHPRAAWDFVGPWPENAALAAVMSYISFFRVPEADYEVEGRRHHVFAHDWRRMGVEEWFARLGERELGAGEEIGAPPAPALSHEAFADAARQAMRDLHRPDALARNPLMRSRAVRDRDARPSPETLRDLIGDAVDSLAVDPRDEKLHRALSRTYVRPARTQEAAAEVLGLAFSTYRRHLGRGVERATAWLWEREMYGGEDR